MHLLLRNTFLHNLLLLMYRYFLLYNEWYVEKLVFEHIPNFVFMAGPLNLGYSLWGIQPCAKMLSKIGYIDYVFVRFKITQKFRKTNLQLKKSIHSIQNVFIECLLYSGNYSRSQMHKTHCVYLSYSFGFM